MLEFPCHFFEVLSQHGDKCSKDGNCIPSTKFILPTGHRYWHRILNTEHNKQAVTQTQSINVRVNKSSKVYYSPFLRETFEDSSNIWFCTEFSWWHGIQINSEKRNEYDLKTVLDLLNGRSINNSYKNVMKIQAMFSVC